MQCLQLPPHWDFILPIFITCNLPDSIGWFLRLLSIFLAPYFLAPTPPSYSFGSGNSYRAFFFLHKNLGRNRSFPPETSRQRILFSAYATRYTPLRSFSDPSVPLLFRLLLHFSCSVTCIFLTFHPRISGVAFSSSDPFTDFLFSFVLFSFSPPPPFRLFRM